jgi:hypothetical protein
MHGVFMVVSVNPLRKPQQYFRVYYSGFRNGIVSLLILV